MINIDVEITCFKDILEKIDKLGLEFNKIKKLEI